MKNFPLFYILFFLLPVTVCANDIGSKHKKNKQLPIVTTENSITQFGITWYFDKAYTTGKFANGDSYVVGPVKIVGINPPSAVISGRTINGSMVNPSPLAGNQQGYDSSTYANTFSAAMNVARPNNQDLSASNTLDLAINSSLVSTISHANPANQPQLQSAAILTVLGTAPPEGSFRPSYSHTDKTIKFNKNQINYSLFSSLTPAASMPSLASVERIFERPWLDHVPGWSARYIHPIDNMNNYGREISVDIGTGALTLNLNYSDAQKETLAIRYIQLGLDLHGIVEAGGTSNWYPDGGHASGRKLPILLAGHVLNDTTMKNIGQRTDVLFGEDAQTFYVSQTDIDNTNSASWNPDTRGGTPETYQASDIGTPEWGIRHSAEPFRDNKAWTAFYRSCCTANAWSGIVLTARIMGLKDSWNHNALFDYQDRYMKTKTTVGWKRAYSRFQKNMWDTYRSHYK